MEIYESNSSLSNDKSETLYNYGKVYFLFAVGLLITGLMTLVYPQILLNDGREEFYFSSLVVFSILLLVSCLGSVISAITRNAIVIGIVYALYSVSLGGLCSVFTVLLGSEFVCYAFLVTGGSFLLMGIVGIITRGRLARWIGILVVALISILIISLFNVFLFNNNYIYWISSGIILLIYLIIASVDVNRVAEKARAHQFSSSNAEALYEAYLLYSDFMIIFIYMLRFLLLILASKNK